jgi:hypothetical protein
VKEITDEFAREKKMIQEFEGEGGGIKLISPGDT